MSYRKFRPTRGGAAVPVSIRVTEEEKDALMVIGGGYLIEGFREVFDYYMAYGPKRPGVTEEVSPPPATVVRKAAPAPALKRAKLPG